METTDGVLFHLRAGLGGAQGFVPWRGGGFRLLPPPQGSLLIFFLAVAELLWEGLKVRVIPAAHGSHVSPPPSYGCWGGTGCWKGGAELPQTHLPFIEQ